MKKKTPRNILRHLQHGREGTACGRGISQPAFIVREIEQVTCPRCLQIEIAALKKESSVAGVYNALVTPR